MKKVLNIEGRLPNLEDLKIDKNHLFNVRQNNEYNKLVLKFYSKLLFNSRYVSNVSYRNRAKEYDKYDKDSITWRGQYEKVVTLENKIANMRNCNSVWMLNVYDTHMIKVLEKTNLCKDRFCNNCKKVKQALRMQRFIPEIEKYKEFGLYHLVLTVPNVEGKDLSNTIKKMNESFAQLVRYFNPKNKKDTVSGINFDKYGYMGAIRSLEVTFKNDSYHPHFHILFCLDYDLEGEGENNINSFSRRNGKITRKFTDTEIMIQKIWKLLMTGKTVTKRNIEKEELGYSVIMDKFKEDDYFELFKYMTKSTKDDNELFTYKNFIDLYFQLKGKRQIQGYGCFFRIKDIDYKEEVDLRFDTFIAILDKYETPRISTEKTEDLYFDTEYELISKSTLYSHIRKIEDREKEKEGGEPSLKNG